MIYDHCMHSHRERVSNPDLVEATIGSPSLPTHIALTTHDIASAFKKTLRDIPGGILGSIALFKALKEIQALKVDAPLMSKLTALALLSLKSHQRFALVCSVFGLLAFLKHDPGTQDGSSGFHTLKSFSPETMSSQALGVVFAPLLVGDLAEDVGLVDIVDSSAKSKPSVREGLFGHRRAPAKTQTIHSEATLEAGIWRANACAAVIESLVHNWEEVVQQISIWSCRDVGLDSSKSNHIVPGNVEANFVDGDNRATPLSHITESIHSTPTPVSRKARMDLFKNLPLPPTPVLDFGPILPRSVSAAGKSLHPPSTPTTAFPMKHLAHSMTSLDLRSTSRWPSLQPARINWRDHNSSENLAWWERQRQIRNSPLVPRRRMGPASSQAEGWALSEPSKAKFGSQRHSIVSMPSSPKFKPAADEPTSCINVAGTAELQGSNGGKNEADTIQLSSKERANTEKLRKSWSSVSHTSHSATLSRSSPLQESNVAKILSPDYWSAPKPSSHRTLSLDKADSAIASMSVASPGLESSSRRENSDTGDEKRRTPFTSNISALSSEPVKPVPSFQTTIGRQFSGQIARSERETKRNDIALARESNSSCTHTTFRNGPLDARYDPPACKHIDIPMEPPIARHLRFGSSSSGNEQSRTPSNEYSDNSSFRGSQRLRVTMLYEKITQLQEQVSARTAENRKLRNQLEALDRSKIAGTLAEQLREAERVARMWRMKAQWAESLLQGRQERRDG